MNEKPSLTEQSEQRIRERAYEIFLARGDEEGNEASDWFAAERELKESNQQQGKKARAADRFALSDEREEIRFSECIEK